MKKVFARCNRRNASCSIGSGVVNIATTDCNIGGAFSNAVNGILYVATPISNIDAYGSNIGDHDFNIGNHDSNIGSQSANVVTGNVNIGDGVCNVGSAPREQSNYYVRAGYAAAPARA